MEPIAFRSVNRGDSNERPAWFRLLNFIRIATLSGVPPKPHRRHVVFPKRPDIKSIPPHTTVPEQIREIVLKRPSHFRWRKLRRRIQRHMHMVRQHSQSRDAKVLPRCDFQTPVADDRERRELLKRKSLRRHQHKMQARPIAATGAFARGGERHGVVFINQRLQSRSPARVAVVFFGDLAGDVVLDFVASGIADRANAELAGECRGNAVLTKRMVDAPFRTGGEKSGRDAGCGAEDELEKVVGDSVSERTQPVLFPQRDECGNDVRRLRWTDGAVRTPRGPRVSQRIGGRDFSGVVERCGHGDCRSIHTRWMGAWCFGFRV